MTYFRSLSAKVRIAALALLVIGGGALGGVLATGGQTPQKPHLALVQRADSSTANSGTTGSTGAPAATTTTVPPTATAIGGGSAPAQSAGSAPAPATPPASAPAAPSDPTPTTQPAPPVTTTTVATTTVPATAGDAWNDAVAAIHAAGLAVDWGACPVDPSGPEPVTGTVPAAGSQVPVGSTVDLCN